MRTDFIQQRIATCLLLPASLLAGCNDVARPISRSTTTQSAPATTQSNLPQWLQQGPADWSDEVWKEYQAALIRSRAPMLRKKDYSVEELLVVTAEVEHFPGEYEDKLKKEWLDKWQSQLQSIELTGGCGCCHEIYTVTGPKAAIAEFPPRPTCLSTSASTEGEANPAPASAPPNECRVRTPPPHDRCDLVGAGHDPVPHLPGDTATLESWTCDAATRTLGVLNSRTWRCTRVDGRVGAKMDDYMAASACSWPLR